MNQKLKGVLNFIFRFGLSFLLLWYLFQKIDTEQTVEILKTANMTYITFAGLIFFVIHFILILRWLVLIKALKLNVTAWNVVRFFFVGLFGNLFLPSAIGGDVIKIVGLCRTSTEKPKVVASVLLDRLSGFAGIVVIAVCSFTFGFHLFEDSSVLIPIVIMGLASAAFVAVLFNEFVYEFFCRVFNFLPKFKKSLMQMHYDISLLKESKGQGFLAIGYSSLCQIILAFCWFLIAKGLHQDISIIYFLIFVPIICVAASFPSIGGLGVREAGAAYLFSKIGVDAGMAVSISLINFLFMILIGIFGGVIYVFTLSSGRVQHHSSDIATHPQDAGSSA